MMSVYAECPACGEKFRRPDGMAGRLEKCPACRHVFRLPTAMTGATGNPAKTVKPKAPPAPAKAAETLKAKETPRPKEAVRFAERPKPEETPKVAEAPIAVPEAPEPDQLPQPNARPKGDSPIFVDIKIGTVPREVQAPPAPVVDIEPSPEPVPDLPADAAPLVTALVVHPEATLPPADPMESPAAQPADVREFELGVFPAPSEPSAPEPAAESSPSPTSVDFVSLAAEQLGAGRFGGRVRAELIRRGLHADDAKDVVNVMGKECNRQRKKGILMVRLVAGLLLAIVNLPAWWLVHRHVPPSRGTELAVAALGLIGLVLFFLGLWRLAIKPTPVNPKELIAVWEEPK